MSRRWRNARTRASHNPCIYKDRIVGDYAGTNPPYQWRVGQAGWPVTGADRKFGARTALDAAVIRTGVPKGI